MNNQKRSLWDCDSSRQKRKPVHIMWELDKNKNVDQTTKMTKHPWLIMRDCRSFTNHSFSLNSLPPPKPHSLNLIQNHLTQAQALWKFLSNTFLLTPYCSPWCSFSLIAMYLKLSPISFLKPLTCAFFFLK